MPNFNAHISHHCFFIIKIQFPLDPSLVKHLEDCLYYSGSVLDTLFSVQFETSLWTVNQIFSRVGDALVFFAI